MKAWNHLLNFRKPLLVGFTLGFQPILHFRTPKNHELTLETSPKPEIMEDILMKFAENFFQGLVIDGLFNNKQMVNEGSAFVEFLAGHTILQAAITTLLLKNLTSEEFRVSGNSFSKEVVSRILTLKEKEDVLEDDVTRLVLRTMRDEEMKVELMGILKWMIERKEIKEGLIDLFSKAVQTDEKVRSAITKALKAALFDILMNKGTVDKIKSFSLKVLEKESKDSEGAIERLVVMFRERMTASQRKTFQKPNEPQNNDFEKDEIREFFFFST